MLTNSNKETYVKVILVLGIYNFKIIIPRDWSVHYNSSDRPFLLDLEFRAHFRTAHCTLALRRYSRHWWHF